MTKYLKQKKNKINKESYIMLSLFFIFLIWQFKDYTLNIGTGLDPSWQLALPWASVKNLQWGKDIVFTYGPYYYFMHGISNIFYGINRILVFTLFLNMLVSFLKCLIVSYYKKLTNNYLKKNYVFISTFILIFLSSAWTEHAILDLILVVNIITFGDIYNKIDKKIDIRKYAKYYFKIIYIAFIISFMPLVKFSYTAISIVHLTIFILMLLYKKRILETVLLSISTIASFVLLWVFAKQDIFNIPSYFKNSFEVSKGYSSAMSVPLDDQSTPRLIFVLFIFSIIVILLFFMFLKRQYLFSILILLIMPQYFLLFKESFTRSDIYHTVIIVKDMSILLLYLIYIIFLYLDHENIFKITKVKQVLLVIFIFTYSFNNILQIQYMPQNDIFSMLKSTKYYELDNSIENLNIKFKEDYNSFSSLSEFINPNESVDIIPWDITLLYLYELNWTPRPVIQSYSNYTANLDKLTASYFYEEHRPDKLIYSLKSIDGRYPIFDEPETFRTILSKYSYIASNDDYIILQNDEQKQQLQMTLIEEQTVHVNDTIKIPEFDSGYLFVKVNWDKSVGGKVSDFLYKAPFNYIKINLATGESKIHRFISDTSKNGIYISNYINDNNDLKNLWLGNTNIDRIESISFTGNSLFYDINKELRGSVSKTFNFSGIFYDDLIKIEFYHLPLNR